MHAKTTPHWLSQFLALGFLAKWQAYVHKGDVIICGLDGVPHQTLVNDAGVRAMEVVYLCVQTWLWMALVLPPPPQPVLSRCVMFVTG